MCLMNVALTATAIGLQPAMVETAVKVSGEEKYDGGDTHEKSSCDLCSMRLYLLTPVLIQHPPDADSCVVTKTKTTTELLPLNRTLK